MRGMHYCKKHKSNYFDGDGCLDCYFERLDKKAATMSLPDRLEDEELYIDAGDEAAVKLRQHYDFVDTILGRVSAGDTFIPLWVFQKAQTLQKTR